MFSVNTSYMLSDLKIGSACIIFLNSMIPFVYLIQIFFKNTGGERKLCPRLPLFSVQPDEKKETNILAYCSFMLFLHLNFSHVYDMIVPAIFLNWNKTWQLLAKF